MRPCFHVDVKINNKQTFVDPVVCGERGPGNEITQTVSGAGFCSPVQRLFSGSWGGASCSRYAADTPRSVATAEHWPILHVFRACCRLA